MGVLDGKSALVTGGGGGFGKASASLLVLDGAAVVLMGRAEDKLVRAKEMLLSQTPAAKVAWISGDACKPDDVEAAVQKTLELDGGGKLDIVIPTVGGGSFGSVLDLQLEKLQADYLLNVGSAFLAVKHAAPHMKNGGAFVFISSTSAASTFVHLASYCASKAALDHFMRVVANELGPKGIRANCVRPGLTRTDGLEPMFQRPGYAERFIPYLPLGRTGFAEDIAGAVRYLAGPEAAWTTGQSFACDGGNELRMMPLPSN
jgi:NAD(P)-dependent dehydrogenase (short-subunit alcohol dehydrogenase family)